MKKQSQIDLSVLLIFFNRPDTFEKVFQAVAEARPSRLLLYQDGPRNKSDEVLIKKCRDIALNIDWECDVHTLFQTENHGCDPSGYLADKWAFSITDKCVILEDDCLPSQSFFPFCKELLDKYEYDQRVWMISGFNHEEITSDTEGDYFFTEFPSIWGWATWRRVIDTWNADYTFLNNPYEQRKVKSIVKERGYRNDFIDFCRKHRNSGIEHFETLLWSSMILNSALAIVPVKNMINNIGISEDSTHFSSTPQLLPAGYRRIFTMHRHDIEFPLSHPHNVISHKNHRTRVYDILAWNRPWRKTYRALCELFLNIRHSNYRHIGLAIKQRIKKIIN